MTMFNPPIKNIILFSFVFLFNTVFAQHNIAISVEPSLEDSLFVRFKGTFIVKDKIGFGTYYVLQIKPFETLEMSPSLSNLFSEKGVMEYTFTFITCKEHDELSFKDCKIGDTLDLKVKTPNGMWFLYGCFHDDDARQKITLPCKCERSVPFYIIETQALVIDE